MNHEQLLVSFWAWDDRVDVNALAPYGQEPRAICEAALKALEA